MYQQPMYGSLPVPIDRPMQENFYLSAPNIPVSFNFNSLPQMQQFNPMVAGYLIKVVQDNAGRNPLRCFTANMLSQNRWVNPEFESAFMAVSDFAFVLLSSGQVGNNPEAAIVQAANQVASCLAAIYTQKFPALMNGMPPQQQQEIQALLATYQQIAQRIGQMRQQMQGGWGGMQQPPMQQGWGQNSMQFQQPRGQWAAAQTQQQPMQQNWPQQTQQSGWGQPQQGWGNQMQQPSWAGQQNQHNNTADAVVSRSNERNSYTPAVQSSQEEQQVEVTKLQGVDAIMEEWGSETSQRYGSGAVPQTQQGSYNPPAQTQAPVQEQPTGKPKQMTVIESLENPGEFHPLDLSGLQFVNKMGFIASDPNRLWDQLVLESGEEVRPAYSSGWKVSYDPAQPYGLFCDPERFMKFHIRKINPDGSMFIREKLVEIEDDLRSSMQYMNHEIRKSLDYRLPEDVKVAEVPWSALTHEPLPVEKLKEHEEAQSKLEEGQEPTPVDILLLDLKKACHTFEEAELNYHKEMICHDVPEDMPVEYSFRKVTPLFLSKPHLAKLAELRQCETLVELSAMLRDTDMDMLLKSKLNSILTEAVNDALAYNLGYGKGLNIDDFIYDMDALGEAIRADGYHTMWHTLNKERYSAIALPALEVLTGDNQSAYLYELIDKTPKEQRRQYQSVLSLVENNVVVHLPGVFGPEFRDDEALQITKEMDEALLGAIRASFGRHHGDQKKRVKHHYFVDSVGNVLEVHRGWLVPGSMLVRRVTAL